MESPVKVLHADDSSSEKQDCFEEVENQQTLENALSHDELRIIFEYLSAKDLYEASSVCRSWRNAAQKEAATRNAPEYFLKRYQIQSEEKTKNYYSPALIGKDLRMKPDFGLVCEKIQEKDEWTPAGCYCKNLPFKCATVIVGGYDIIADDAKIDKAFGMAACAFLPQIPKLNRQVYGQFGYDHNSDTDPGGVTETMSLEAFVSKISELSRQVFGQFSSDQYLDIPSMENHAKGMLKSLLPSEGEKSKCIILLTNQKGYKISSILVKNLQKSYKPGTISLWGGICVDIKFCGNGAEICSEPIQWTAITLSSPSLQTWSIVLPRKCRTEPLMEDKLQNFKKNIKLKKHSLCLMFACCERIHIKDAEIRVFKKVFPDIPLIGLHGDGEFGLNTLSKVRESQLQHAYSTIFLILTYQ